MNGITGTSLLIIPALLLVACQGARPANLGVHDGRLAPCPSSPNCVSSLAADDRHRVDPFPFSGPAEEALRRMRDIVLSLPRTAAIADGSAYLHVGFTSAVFRFVDDVEFLADDEARVIHVRSASRLGTWDLGANRRRIERIRLLWNGPRG